MGLEGAAPEGTGLCQGSPMDSFTPLIRKPRKRKEDSMKTTIDIPEDALHEAMRHTGAKTKREAMVIALTELNRRRRLQRLTERFGTLDGFMTQEEPP